MSETRFRSSDRRVWNCETDSTSIGFGIVEDVLYGRGEKRRAESRTEEKWQSAWY